MFVGEYWRNGGVYVRGDEWCVSECVDCGGDVLRV